MKEKLLHSSLEKIFIENRVYRDIEECETFEAVIQTIDSGLTPFKAQFYREITEEDILKLTEIRIKRISKYDSFKADESMRRLEKELEEIEDNLANLTRFAINYYRELLKKYSKGKERRTEIRSFNTIAATVVAAANQKLYVNRDEGFIGYSLKKDEYVMDCSDIDDIIAIRRDGKYKIVKIDEKVFVGKDIVYVSVFKKNDERKIYNIIYLDGKSGVSYAKRFQISGITREKDYDLTLGTNKSKLIYFSANENGEAEVVTINLNSTCSAKLKVYDFDFKNLLIKNRSAMGNVLTKYPVRKIAFKTAGKSTLGGVDLWYDKVLGRLNRDERGQYLGNFNSSDSILVLYTDGSYELTNFDLTNHYDPKNVLSICLFSQESTVISTVYFDATQKNYFAKRFKIETTTIDKKFLFITDVKGSKLIHASTDEHPKVEVVIDEGKGITRKEAIVLSDFIEVKGWKAMGNKLSIFKIKEVKPLVSEVRVIQKANIEVEETNVEIEEESEGQLGLF